MIRTSLEEEETQPVVNETQMNAHDEEDSTSLIPTCAKSNYVLLGDRIGGGGFSDVYLARRRRRTYFKVPWRKSTKQRSTDQSDGVGVRDSFLAKYAVKVCETDAARVKVPNANTLTEQELRVAQLERVQLSTIEDIEKEVTFLKDVRGNKNMIRFYDAFILESTKQCFIVTEALKIDLGKIIQEDPLETPIKSRARRIVLKEVCEALIFLKSKRILHRDIKPSNILLSSMGQVKLCDFGVAEYMLEGDEDWIATEEEKGSTEFMAPELFIPGKAYDYGIDVWSFGITAFACFNKGVTPLAKLFRRNEGDLMFEIAYGFPLHFDADAWQLFARGPLRFLTSFIGVHALSVTEYRNMHQQSLKKDLQGPLPPNEKQQVKRKAHVAAQIEKAKPKLEWGHMLRLCLVPLTGTCPGGDPEDWPEGIFRYAIEDVRQAKYFTTSLTESELQQRILVGKLVKFAVSGKDEPNVDEVTL